MVRKITKKTKLSELMKDEKAVEVLFKSGLTCLGCPMAMNETLEEGCLSHGIDAEEVLKKINKKKK